jgi:hypothetical protein
MTRCTELHVTLRYRRGAGFMGGTQLGYAGCEFITVFRFNLVLRLKFVMVVNDDNCEKIMMMMIMMIKVIMILP